eukprot:CAMPEP_0172557842 /NCGR_PEP_ID=MMETSP1067-20121228/75685_1 /TAXON_ID=265564 ORGANISM="Thalassiosira punctigera, Strain Tpunct2005C2" /NCGR_SAMPLE_ID=MMETSP1067 /ASSEMBLY_ACC=CAM_ASM_000444 /LENGTH=63 /DNA_ID=CAMNT_0013347043 /DNA_START=55 /DNA_END=243 /DNA_ORIENTATION=+
MYNGLRLLFLLAVEAVPDFWTAFNVRTLWPSCSREAFSKFNLPISSADSSTFSFQFLASRFAI